MGREETTAEDIASYLVRTCYDSREVVRFLSAAFYKGFDDAGVVGAEIDEAVSYTSLGGVSIE